MAQPVPAPVRPPAAPPPAVPLSQADGRSWSTLVQGLRCGSLIPTDSPTESADSLCTTNAVRSAAGGAGGASACCSWRLSLLRALLLLPVPLLALQIACCLAAVPPGACALKRCRPTVLPCCRLALMQPPWQPSIHALWPQRFRDAARLLLLASGCSDDGGGSQHGGGHFAAGAAAGAGARKGSARGLPLARDAVLEVLAAAAYPVSAWL